MRTLGEVLRLSTEHLKQRGVEGPRLDAELLVGAALGLERLQVYLQHDRPLLESELQAIRELVQRRSRREPLAHILGKREFYGLEFQLRPGVLVPRPDTETLVDALLDVIGPDPEPLVYVADIGCGSGCIGLSLASQRPSIRLYAIDLNPEALAATKANTQALGLSGRVALLRGDLLGPVPSERQVDWVVSNPPYIPSAEIDGLQPEVARFEDRLALDGGADGLDLYRRLLPMAWARAQRGIVLEVGHGQAEAVVELARKAGFRECTIRCDLGGRQRVVLARRGAGECAARE